MRSERFTFDCQAAGFDDRAGLPDEVGASIALGIESFVGDLPGSRVLLDVGAGTGEVGRHVIASGKLKYVGLDSAMPMLRVFSQKLGVAASPSFPGLICADARRSWPLPGKSVGVVFLSRAAHLLDADHMAAECLRVASLELHIGVGRVKRSKDGVKSTLRRHMRELLRDRGIQGRDGEKSTRSLIDAFTRIGANPSPPRTEVVARWEAWESPSASLSAWRNKSGLAGASIPPVIKDEVLKELESYARRVWDDFDTPRRAEERYDLTVFSIS